MKLNKFREENFEPKTSEKFCDYSRFGEPLLNHNGLLIALASSKELHLDNFPRLHLVISPKEHRSFLC